MGDHVSMDAYNYRFDKVTEKVKNKKRCVDDSLLYSYTLEEASYQTAKGSYSKPVRVGKPSQGAGGGYRNLPWFLLGGCQKAQDNE